MSDLSARIGLPKAFKLTVFGFVPMRQLVWLQIKPFGRKGYEPPLINGPYLQYKLILVWRGFTKTVPCIHFCHSVDDEIILLISSVIKHLRLFEGL